MKTVSAFKWGMNPKHQRAGANGAITWAANRPDAGDDDHAAVQVAVDAANGGEVIGLTPAGGDVAFAACRGAQRTIAIDGWDMNLQPLQIAKILAAAVENEGGVDVVAIGDSAWSPMVPTLMAGILGWNVISAVDEVKYEDGKLVVVRRFGSGTQDIEVATPVVLAVAARREGEKISMKQVLAARKKPVSTVAIADLGVSEEANYAIVENRKPDAIASKIFDGTEDVEGAVAQFVQALQVGGVL